MLDLARRGIIGLAAFMAVAAGARAAAQSRSGLFIIRFSAGPGWLAGAPMSQQPGLRAHGEYMARLFAAQRLYAGGPFMQDDGAAMGEGGMMIVHAERLDEVEAILAADPAIVSGVFAAEVVRWRARFRAEAPLPQ